MENTSPRRILAENLRIIRLVRNLSQEALADLAGLDRSYIGGIEHAQRNLSLDNVEKLSRALGISIPDLLREVDHHQLGYQILEVVRGTVDSGHRKSR